ncbi:alpha/beta fold hydrolase [Streptomyces glomeratus]|uniref:Alpha/beta hydrolase n=1 Tax=Streptomyces glomeratus TaxID=284452 RepID=A0ABP6M7X5_9ACTN|nr:alpha/beta hydrolase [Streptomyces glomeratus]MCF1511778.1 alpha/beta hydrolase [Streptomyces glomeratus]
MPLGYNTAGTGATKVIWAHSWLAGQESYDCLIPYLDTERFTWVFPDFRGYGRSRALAGDFSVREMGNDLLQLADTLGWDDFHLVGHSMGGQAAQWVSGQPEARSRLSSLVLLCAVPSRAFPLDADGTKLFEEATENRDARATVITAVTGGRLGTGFVRYVNEVSHKTADPAAMRAYLRVWTQEDVSEEVRGYQRPVLVLTGRHDPVLPAALAEQQIVPQYADVRSLVLEGAAHLPPMETPARTVALIEEHFLGGADNAGG